MIQKSLLQKAVDQKIITSSQLEPLYQFLSKQAEVEADASVLHEEPLRFIRSFGDVFIALGVLFFTLAFKLSEVTGYAGLIPVVVLVGLAEWLVLRRKLVLPGMVILISILYFINQVFTFEGEQTSVMSLALVSVSSLLFYLRYRMPFSLFPLALSLVLMIVMQAELDIMRSPVILTGLGCLVLGFALAFDIRDTKRQTYLSDSGFWLHLLAAPLIVHGVMAEVLLTDSEWLSDNAKQIIMLLFFVIFFLLALFLDRRAIIIATQVYVIYSLVNLLRFGVNDKQQLFIYVLLILGAVIIYFGTYWQRSRQFVFGFLAKHPVSRYVPDLH